MSKAWFKPSAVPQLIARFEPQSAAVSQEKATGKAVEVWTTTCIVTNFGMRRGRESHGNDSSGSLEDLRKPRCSTLINPANPNLSGPHSFPYFPRGGPQPEELPNRHAHHIMGYVSQWGGMDVGNGMLFSAAVVDGLVHQLGGLKLRAECALLPPHPQVDAYLNQQTTNSTTSSHSSKDSPNEPKTIQNTIDDSSCKEKCPVGMAIQTSPGGSDLQSEYDRIIHTVPPFYKYPPTRTKRLKQILDINAKNESSESDVNKKQCWSRELLQSCYRTSLSLAFNTNQHVEGKGLFDDALKFVGLNNSGNQQYAENQRVAVPLLGAGCRGFPVDVALEVAAAESAAWLLTSKSCKNHGDNRKGLNCDECVLAFGLLETKDAENLASRICELLENP